MGNFLDPLISRIQEVRAGGIDQPARSALNFDSSLTVIDDSIHNQTTVGVSSGIGKPIANIAALRLLNDGSPLISLISHTIVADNGGGTFDFDPLDSTTADNGGTVIVDAGGRRYKRRYAGDLKVEWFGASTSGIESAINAAIQAMPSSGGTLDLRGLHGSYTATAKITIDRSVEILFGKAATFTWTSAIGIEVQKFFRLRGDDRSVTLTSANNGTLIKATGVFPGSTGDQNIIISGVHLQGTGASTGVDTSTATFNEGQFLVEDCRISGFGTTGINISTSFYFNTIRNCTFDNNGISLIVGDSANTDITNNKFVLGTTGESVRTIGFGTNIWENYFEGHSSYPDSADIVCYPNVDDSNGGFARIWGNVFLGENEGLNPNRRRLSVKYATTPGNSSPPCEVLANLFIGMTQKGVVSASVNGSHLVTYQVTNHGIPTGQSANVHIFNCDNATYNGKFTVTATDANHFTATCTRTTGVYANSGIVVMGDSHAAIGFENPEVKWAIDNNHFGNYGTVIDDSYSAVPSVTVGGTGKSVFGPGNTVSGPFSFGARLFSNGGQGFERIEAPAGVGFTRLANSPEFAPTKIENQILYSETFSNAAWVVSGTVTKTTGQTDPYGGTAAVKLVADGTSAGQSFHQDYTASGGTTQIVEFWAKAAAETDGSANSSLLVGLFDNSSGVFQCGTDRIRLSTTWQKHRLVFTGVNSADSMRLDFRAGGNAAMPCTFYLAFPQVSDAPSYYVATTGAAISTQAFAALQQPGTLTTRSTELVLEETGDSGGITRIHLQNRFGIAGPTIENAAANVVDLIFQGSTDASRIRWEPRGGGNAFISGANKEWQIGTVSDPTFVVGETATGVMLRAPDFRWSAGVALPTFGQDDQTAASTNGQKAVWHGQNATGVTSNGGALDIATGTGTNANSDGLGRLLAGAVVRVQWNDTGVGFYTTAPVGQQTVTGAKVDLTATGALAHLLTALANLGLIVDGST